MWAKGRQPQKVTAKEEALTIHPFAHVKRKIGDYGGGTITGYGLFLGKGQNWDNATPVVTRWTAEECWREACRIPVDTAKESCA